MVSCLVNCLLSRLTFPCLSVKFHKIQPVTIAETLLQRIWRNDAAVGCRRRGNVASLRVLLSISPTELASGRPAGRTPDRLKSTPESGKSANPVVAVVISLIAQKRFSLLPGLISSEVRERHSHYTHALMSQIRKRGNYNHSLNKERRSQREVCISYTTKRLPGLSVSWDLKHESPGRRRQLEENTKPNTGKIIFPLPAAPVCPRLSHARSLSLSLSTLLLACINRKREKDDVGGGSVRVRRAECIFRPEKRWHTPILKQNLGHKP